MQTGGREDEAKHSEVQCPSIGVGSGWLLEKFAREEHEPDKRDASGHRHDRVVRGHFCPVDLQSVVGLRQSEHAVTLGAVGSGRRTCEFARGAGRFRTASSGRRFCVRLGMACEWAEKSATNWQRTAYDVARRGG